MTKIKPEFIDTNRGYSRVYRAENVSNPSCGEPAYKFVDSGVRKSISQMNGEICLPTDQVQMILKYYNEYNKKKANCP